MDRRTFLWATGCAVAATGALAAPRKIAPSRFGPAFRDAVLETERASGGRLGLAVIDTGSGERFAHRADERFPMCSTFKFALAAAILERVESGQEKLARRLPVAKTDLVSHSPFCETRVGGTASLAELCHATVTVSDNAAANLLLRTMGGPAGFTRRLRGFGDSVTRLDRWETDMSKARPGDVRDTTTPDAMAGLAQRLLLGRALATASRTQLVDWMKQTTTGLKGIRDGVPANWQVADKTGSGGYGTDNHVAVLWPPRGAPLVVASYVTGSSLPSGQTRPLHARIGRAIVAAVG
ncbi:class A beta-lactamase [Sphingomonas sp. DT-207]|uniref:class A beta-lactamase n=1 Tax=Sphingomonas sp. DT-207 TaxID=3396167 RepID=UPI003F1C27FF